MSNSPISPDNNGNSQGVALEAQVEKRLGLLPNFFRLSSETLEIRQNLWGFAQAAYLDNPLPPLFKERLFVHLSRFCEIRYCVARHVGFLLGLGRPAGDPHCTPHSVKEVVLLLERPVARGEDLACLISFCADLGLLEEMPGVDSETERAVFACASHIFLRTTDAPACLRALRKLIGETRFEYVLLLLMFVRSAHYWTELHPELVLEDDIQQLLTAHEALAECVFREPETRSYEVRNKLLDDLEFLRQQAEQTGRLRDLTNQMLQMQDAERRILARELHDSTGQMLSLLNIHLSQLRKRVQSDLELQSSVETCISLASETTNHLRTVSYLLHPPLLEELGLAPALRQFAVGYEDRSGIAVAVEVSSDFSRLPQDLEIALFRVTQEALTNVHRHSDGKRVAIRLCSDKKQVLLEVEDNGKGMSPEKIRELRTYRLGVGIAGMQERVRPFGGVLDIQSTNTGTKIIVVLPLPSVHTTASTG